METWYDIQCLAELKKLAQDIEAYLGFNKSFDLETNQKYNKSEKSIKDFSKPNSCFEEKKINFATSENLKERIFFMCWALNDIDLGQCFPRYIMKFISFSNNFVYSWTVLVKDLSDRAGI